MHACTDDALLMHCWCTDDAQVMHWWCPSVISYILEISSFKKYSICRVFCAVWWYDDHHMIIWWSSYEDMMMMTRCQDHILTENIWFVWSRTSYSGDKWRCHRCGTNDERRTREDSATQPMDSWRLSLAISRLMTMTMLILVMVRPALRSLITVESCAPLDLGSKSATMCRFERTRCILLRWI